jgi:hypothetical protein
MSKITKALLLFVIALVFIVVSIFDLTFGTLNLIVNVLRLPFKLASQWLVEKANEVNIK